MGSVVVRIDGATMGFDDFLGYGQAKAGTAVVTGPRFVSACKTFEDGCALIMGNAGPVIRDRELDETAEFYE